MPPEAGGISPNPIHAAQLKQRIRIKSRATLTAGRNQQVRPRCRRIPAPEVCRISGRRHTDWRWVWGECHLCDRSLARRCGHVEWGWGFCRGCWDWGEFHLCDRSLARRCGHVEWGWAFCQHLCDSCLARCWQWGRCFLPAWSLAREGICKKSANGVQLVQVILWCCFLSLR